MALHYLMDGYNILYALPNLPPGPWEKKRDALLLRITTYKPQGQNQLTVVFDSREGAGSQSRKGDIQVAFTAGETADDWISQHVRRASNPRVIVVITNDQGLRRLIRGTGAKTISAEEFWRQTKTPGNPRTEPQTTIETDAITEELKKKWL